MRVKVNDSLNDVDEEWIKKLADIDELLEQDAEFWLNPNHLPPSPPLTPFHDFEIPNLLSPLLSSPPRHVEPLPNEMNVLQEFVDDQLQAVDQPSVQQSDDQSCDQPICEQQPMYVQQSDDDFQSVHGQPFYVQPQQVCEQPPFVQQLDDSQYVQQSDHHQQVYEQAFVQQNDPQPVHEEQFNTQQVCEQLLVQNNLQPTFEQSSCVQQLDTEQIHEQLLDERPSDDDDHPDYEQSVHGQPIDDQEDEEEYHEPEDDDQSSDDNRENVSEPNQMNEVPLIDTVAHEVLDINGCKYKKAHLPTTRYPVSRGKPWHLLIAERNKELIDMEREKLEKKLAAQDRKRKRTDEVEVMKSKEEKRKKDAARKRVERLRKKEAKIESQKKTGEQRQETNSDDVSKEQKRPSLRLKLKLPKVGKIKLKKLDDETYASSVDCDETSKDSVSYTTTSGGESRKSSVSLQSTGRDDQSFSDSSDYEFSDFIKFNK